MRKKPDKKSHATVPIKGQSHEMFCTRFFYSSAPIQSQGYINCPPTPWLACVCGVGGGRLNCNPQHTRLFDLFKHIRWIPARRAILLKVGGYSRAPPSVEPHTSKLHAQVLWRIYGGGWGLPSTIVFLLGLSLPIAVVWAVFSCHGAKRLSAYSIRLPVPYQLNWDIQIIIFVSCDSDHCCCFSNIKIIIA